MPGIAASISSATVRSCTAEFCRMSRLARWKPKQSTARRSSRSRPRAITRELFGDQRAIEHVEIGLELLGAGIGRRLADRRAGGFDLEPRRGRGQPRIDAGHGQPIGLAAPVRRGVGRALGQRAQFLGDIGQVRRDRQFGAERMQFLEIEAAGRGSTAAARCRASPRRSRTDCRRGRRRSSFPSSGTTPVRPGSPPSSSFRRSSSSAMQPRHLVQEGVIVERQPVGDLVEHGELGPAQQIGLPQRQHLAAQLLVGRLGLFRRELHPFAPVEKRGDLHLAVDRALAADFGRMRGQHRADQGVSEKLPQVGGAEAGGARMATASAPACPRAACRRARSARASGECCSGLPRCWRGARNS